MALMAVFTAMAPVFAQEPDASRVATRALAPEPIPEPTIVVTGSRKKVRDELQSLLGETADQLPRMESPFCPLIMGFDPEYTRTLKKLVLKNAIEAGVKVAEPPCAPNAVTIFIDEPHRLAVEMRKKFPAYFGRLSVYRRDRLLEPGRPYYSWERVGLATVSGRFIDERPGSANADTIADISAPVVRTNIPTRLSRSTSASIRTAFLVIDINRTEGKTLSQIADFMTLHLLLKLQHDAWEDTRQDSLLRLFDAPDPSILPQQMSAFDRRMLQGLYAMRRNDVDGNVQRGRIAAHMKRTASESETP
ncbi:MAG: hypothetical protein WA908_03715 [Pontixanthobacter sp.]